MVIHVGVNDLLENKNMHCLDELATNLRNMALKCRSFEITKVYICGIVVDNTTSGSLIKSISIKISEMCRGSSCGFIGSIGNKNIQRVYL